MPVSFAKAPEESDRAVKVGLDEIFRLHPQTRMLSGIGGGLETTSTSSPHQVYTLRLDDLRNGKGIASAQLDGWRYLVRTPGSVHSAEVGLGGGGNSMEFRGLNTGQTTESMANLLQAAESNPTIRNGDFECALLRANALNLAAVWFKDQKGTQDYIVPLSPAPRAFTVGKLYSIAEFDALLIGVARNKRALEAESESES